MSKMLPKKYSDKIDVDMKQEVNTRIIIGGDAE